MQIYERIIELRKEHLPKRENKKISQTEFGEKIGVSRSVIKNLELGIVEAKDHMIKLICQTFNVNEDWLRNGTEPIFKEKTDDVLQQVFEEYNLSEFMQEIVKGYLDLPKYLQEAFEEFVKTAVKKAEEKPKEENEIRFIANEEDAKRWYAEQELLKKRQQKKAE